MIQNQQEIVKRLRIARGHLRKVIKMVEDEDYCIDILQQSIAIQNALKRADEEILAGHLTHCVKGVLSGQEKDKQLAEILEIFKKGRN